MNDLTALLLCVFALAASFAWMVTRKRPVKFVQHRLTIPVPPEYFDDQLASMQKRVLRRLEDNFTRRVYGIGETNSIFTLWPDDSRRIQVDRVRRGREGE